ncbi:(1-3)-beta-glucanase [Paramecium bursaria Chlorella virus NE-JV-1]|nr:(1-3)-beta-glucanase [Paramecium bursaria Chlorella virus NE-JV-1]
MSFDLESNSRPKRSNKWLVPSLLIFGVITAAGITVGILYGTGVIWNNADSQNIPDTTNIFRTTGSVVHILPTINDINATLMWNDEFDDTILDSSKWNSEIDPRTYKKKYTQQTYTSNEQNLRVFNGNLEITARNDTGIITSGWVDTSNKFDFFPDEANNITGILVETKILLPHPGQGFWPCFWINPSNITRYGDSPASGEIDIMETINDFNFMLPVVHYGGPTKENGDKTWVKLRGPWFEEYHVYSLLWEVDTITFFIDGEEVLRVFSSSINQNGWYTTGENAGPNAPFDAPFYIIMNFAIGGNWAKPTDDTTVFPATMFVDYVRVFALTF